MTTATDRLLRRLEWQVIRRLDGRLQGAYRTVWRGAGIDFTDLRSYTPEDDVRHIDWNVTARLDEPYVRQYTEDRDLTAWLVLDRSASMRFGVAGNGKDSVLNELAACIARLLSQRGNRVGAILYDNQAQQVIPPRTGRMQTLRLTHELTKPQPARGAGAITDLAAMLRLAAATARSRSLVFVISDFIGELGWDRALTMLAHRHEVVVVRIVDPVELDLPDLGLVVVEDAETGEQVVVDTSDPLLRQRLNFEIQARESALQAAMDRAGVTAHRITTDQDLAQALIGMVRLSRRRRR
ncbi:MAG TPA: DUF58 domain-containing protein [Micromonosporaceae bacterium]|nr:DUF58 domain-containing protein [Micromonosporaceae bacterium]HCU52639.1 DUF58 domain-containing protein [Micromonosporaceae bacterium]